MQTISMRTRIANALSDLKTLLMLSLKATREAYSTILLHAWWAPLQLLILAAYDQFSVALSFLLGVYVVVFGYWLFVVLCAVRSSVDRKDTIYFHNKFANFFTVYLCTVTFGFVLFWVLRVLLRIEVGTGLLAHNQLFIVVPIGVWVTIFTLFLLDSGYHWPAIRRIPWNVNRFLLSNSALFLPIMVFIWGFLVVCSYLNGSLMLALINFGLVFMVTPFYGALVSTIYIKRVYENNKVYFPVE